MTSPIDLARRSFLTLKDFSEIEILALIDLAAELKAAKRRGDERPRLDGKNLALLFEKTSTRTRAGFEVAAFDQGARVSYIGPGDSQLGHKESVKDTARVLGRLYDGIEFRGFEQRQAEELAAWAGVPVWNGLTDLYHPTQVIADFLTMREHAGRPLSSLRACFVGNATGNVAHSLMIGAARVGLDLRLAAPRSYWPDAAEAAACRDMAKRRGGEIRITDDAIEAVRACDFVYTDVWVSMGEPDAVWEERLRDLAPYRVTSELMQRAADARFMHCLPAFHNAETTVGQRMHQAFGVAEMEVTDAVFESEASIVFDQAENRLHTIKAVLVATLGA